MTGTPWTTAQLDRIDIADELDIPATQRQNSAQSADDLVGPRYRRP